ncbi:MAG TPA: MFS transporter, partial [Cellulomonas sp.]
VLACFGLVMAATSAMVLGETLPPARRNIEGVRGAGARYRVLLRDRVYVGAVVVSSMCFTTMFSYLSSSSFLYQEDFGLSAQQYGFLFAANAVGMTICSQISARLMRRHSPARVMARWLAAMLVGTTVLLVAGMLGAPPTVLVVLVSTAIIANGGANAPIQVVALSRHGEHAGTAASVLGAANFGLAGLISPLVGALGVSVTSMAAVMVAAVVVANAGLWLVIRPSTVEILR